MNDYLELPVLRKQVPIQVPAHQELQLPEQNLVREKYNININGANYAQIIIDDCDWSRFFFLPGVKNQAC